MYTSWFRFTRLPFRLRPEPAFLFLPAPNAERYESLCKAMRQGSAVVYLTGISGVGKTTLLESAIPPADDGLLIARLLQPDLSVEELHAALLDQLGAQDTAAGGSEALKLVQNFLAEQHARGGRTLILVDDAHRLTPSVVKALSNLSIPPAAPALVLAGEPGLRQLLHQAGRGWSSERLPQALPIAPLSATATEAYIRHRLTVAGATRDDIFKSETFAEIHRYTGGVPRLINVLCDKALGLAESRSSDTVGLREVQDAVRDLKWTEYASDPLPESEPVVVAEPTDRPAPTLILHNGRTELRRMVLKEGRLSIGRGPDNGLPIDSQWISRTHCQIVVGKNGCFLEDLGSTNGVLVNSRRIRLRRLQHKDVISLGEHTLTFSLSED